MILGDFSEDPGRFVAFTMILYHDSFLLLMQYSPIVFMNTENFHFLFVVRCSNTSTHKK